MGFVATIFNSLISLLGTAAVALLQLLPNSPFNWSIAGASQLTVWIFWLIPIPQILTLVTSYVTAVALYYVIRVALRWVKVVGA